jgi:hypothetical protein
MAVEAKTTTSKIATTIAPIKNHRLSNLSGGGITNPPLCEQSEDIPRSSEPWPDFSYFPFVSDRELDSEV